MYDFHILHSVIQSTEQSLWFCFHFKLPLLKVYTTEQNNSQKTQNLNTKLEGKIQMVSEEV